MADPRRDIQGLLLHAAAVHRERLAIDDESARWTYEELARRAALAAGALEARGASKGDAVAWIGDNGPAAALAYFASALAGTVLVPLHLRLTDADLRRILEHAGVRLVLAEPPSKARALALGASVLVLDAGAPAGDATSGPVAVAPADPAHLYYTSGSTGTPKGVVLTHGNVATHASLAAKALGLTSADTWLHAAPMFHLADAWATFAVTLVGGVHRFVPRFEEEAVLSAFGTGVTVTNLVPTMWSALVRHPAAAGRAWPSLRLLLSGGAAISPDLVRRVRATFGAEYAQTYGLTETSPYLTISRLAREERGLSEDEACRRLARAGRPMPGVEVRVVGPAGDAVPADGSAVGEVWARGPTVTRGYFRDPEATAAALTADGWLKTGDLARVHEDGRIDLVDRAADVVNSGGEKVFTADVERVLAGLPGVREVAVVGTPDPHWGEVVTAVVVPEGTGVTLEALRSQARAHLADFKLPRRLVLVGSLPRTASGKVSKRDVRAAAADAAGGAARPLAW